MLASFIVVLTPEDTSALGDTLGRSLHGLLLRLVAEADPRLANELHSDSSNKPFTVSTLQGRFIREKGRTIAQPGSLYRVRYTVLNEGLFNALSRTLLGKLVVRSSVAIDGSPFRVADIVIAPEASAGWAQIIGYDELVRQARTERRIALEFKSPTTFRTGDQNLLFPLPSSVFGSYARKWREHAQASLPADLELFVQRAVAAERYRLETAVVSYGRHQFNGFVGECHFRILEDSLEHTRALNVLADFALFSGTGQKTTQGLGQTRRLAP